MLENMKLTVSLTFDGLEDSVITGSATMPTTDLAKAPGRAKTTTIYLLKEFGKQLGASLTEPGGSAIEHAASTILPDEDDILDAANNFIGWVNEYHPDILHEYKNHTN